MTPWLAALVTSGALLLARHPTHGSVAELREKPGDAVEVAIRVFADDIERVVPGAGAGTADSALARYVRDGFTIAGQGGAPVELRWQGARRSGEVLLLRLAAELPGGLAGATVSHTILLERFADQVNLVRAAYRGRTATLVFLAGDSAKQLP